MVILPERGNARKLGGGGGRRGGVVVVQIWREMRRENDRVSRVSVWMRICMLGGCFWHYNRSLSSYYRVIYTNQKQKKNNRGNPHFSFPIRVKKKKN